MQLQWIIKKKKKDFKSTLEISKHGKYTILYVFQFNFVIHKNILALLDSFKEK